MTTTGAPSRRRRIGAWFEVRFRSPAAIYGLIVYAALLSVDSDHADDTWDMLVTSLWAIVIFFVAHVFAHTLTDHGELGLGRAVRDAVRHASGMLYAAVPGSIALAVMGLRGASPGDAYEASMWVTVAVLAVLGYLAYWRRGAHVVVRVLGAVGTAALGVLIILLEYALH